MSKAEEFIKEHARNCSNKVEWNVESLTPDYIPWLSPAQARKAVEIAREEMLEKVCSFIDDNMADYVDIRGYIGDAFIDVECDRFINDLKQAIKDE